MSAPKNVVIFFSGRGSNMRAILDQVENGILKGVAQVPFVVTNRMDAGGIEIAAGRGIETRVIPSKGLSREAYDALLLKTLAVEDIAAIILAGYMRILSPPLVSAYRGRILNVHPADTSAHQGLDGYAWAFEKKLPETWVTVHIVDEGLDTGPVLKKARVDLTGVTNLADVEARGLAVEHEVYSQALRDFLMGVKEQSACAAS